MSSFAWFCSAGLFERSTSVAKSRASRKYDRALRSFFDTEFGQFLQGGGCGKFHGQPIGILQFAARALLDQASDLSTAAT